VIRRGVLLALALVALVAGRVAAEPTQEQSERLERAGTLVEDRAGWDEAITLYRALLVESPEWTEPRLGLARVLAWRGDYGESLEHYERVAASPGAPPDLATERAEVLSWAGRNSEARVLFEEVLARSPDDPRAARGLARTYLWSGQRTKANVWYVRALALQDDAEARQEYGALRGELKKKIGADAFAFFDSEKFSYIRTGADASLDWDFDTRIYAYTGAVFIARDRNSDEALLDSADHDSAIEGRLGVERRFATRWKGTAELGGRGWEHADDRVLARGVLEYAPNENAVAALAIDYGDQLEHSYSLESVQQGIGRTGGKLSYWRQLSSAWEGYGEVGGAWLSDSNGEIAMGGSVAWRPFADVDVQIAMSLDAMHYEELSPYYYSPDIDLGGTLSMMGRVPIHGALSFVFDAGGGAGFSQEQGTSSFGPAYRAKLGLRWDRGGFSIAIDAARSQSVRASSYTTHEAALRVSWSF
jgi:tetratricopeptide (TPR) repeat protein